MQLPVIIGISLFEPIRFLSGQQGFEDIDVVHGGELDVFFRTGGEVDFSAKFDE